MESVKELKMLKHRLSYSQYVARTSPDREKYLAFEENLNSTNVCND